MEHNLTVGVISSSVKECLRDIGIADECIKNSTPYERIPLARHSSTFFDGEYVRANILGNGNDREVCK